MKLFVLYFTHEYTESVIISCSMDSDGHANCQRKRKKNS